MERTLSIRLTVPAVSLPYPQPLPDIDPDASNTIMASSVQGECCSRSLAATPQKTAASAVAKAVAEALQESEACIVGMRGFVSD